MSKDKVSAREYNQFKEQVNEVESKLSNIYTLVLPIFFGLIIGNWILAILLGCTIGKFEGNFIVLFVGIVFLSLFFGYIVVISGLNKVIYNKVMSIYGLKEIYILRNYFEFNNLYKDGNLNVLSMKDILSDETNIKKYHAECKNNNLNDYIRYIKTRVSNRIDLTEELEDELFKKNKFLSFEDYLKFKDELHLMLVNDSEVKSLSKNLETKSKVQEYLEAIN